MYYDLSLLPTNMIEVNHLLKNIQEASIIGAAAIDYEFVDSAIPPVPQSFNKIKQNHPQVRLYSRATLIIQQNATLHSLNKVSHNGYDITAVRPKNQKIFHALCVECENFDIISLDMGAKIPFMLKRNPVYEALRKGKYFQLQYSAMFEDNTRVICMTNMINVIKATGGKNLIISSHTDNFKTHRTPYDVAALMTSLGMNKNQVLATMKESAQILLKSAIHRTFFKGTIKQIPEIMVKKLNKKIQKHRQALKKLHQTANEKQCIEDQNSKIQK